MHWIWYDLTKILDLNFKAPGNKTSSNVVRQLFIVDQINFLHYNKLRISFREQVKCITKDPGIKEKKTPKSMFSR